MTALEHGKVMNNACLLECAIELFHFGIVEVFVTDRSVVNKRQRRGRREPFGQTSATPNDARYFSGEPNGKGRGGARATREAGQINSLFVDRKPGGDVA